MNTPPAESASVSVVSNPAGLLASYGARVAAYLLDAVFANLVVILGSLASSSALVVIGFVGALIYPFATMLRSGPTNGQTFGKQILGIRVVPQSAVPMSFGTVFLRELIGKWLLGGITFGLYSLLDYLWPAWDHKNQALHDKIASTLVVKADAERALIPSIGTPIVFASPTSAPSPVPPPPPPPPSAPSSG